MKIQKVLTVCSILILGLGYIQKLNAECFEINMSTCVGDFANGGDTETAERLLGNISTYGLGFIQNNKISIYISSGTRIGYDQARGTPTSAGKVGIWTDGISQFPQYHLDINGVLRSTDSAYFVTGTTNYVAIGTTSATSRLDVFNGSITVRGNNAGIWSQFGVVATTYSFTSVTANPSAPTGAIAYRSDTGSLIFNAPSGWVTLSTASVGGGTALDTSASTQTKLGGLIINGNVNAGSFTGNGAGITAINALSAGVVFSSNVAANTIQGANISSATYLVVSSLTIINTNAVSGASEEIDFGPSHTDVRARIVQVLDANGRGEISLQVYPGGAANTSEKVLFVDDLGVHATTVTIGATGTNPATSALDIVGGSITVRGGMAGINIIGGGLVATTMTITDLAKITSMTVYGTLTSTSGFRGAGSTFTTITYPDGSISTTAVVAASVGGGGGGVSISTVAQVLRFPGDIFQATSPFVAVQGSQFGTGRGTFNVIAIEVSVIRASTKSATFFQLARSSVTGGGTAFEASYSGVIAITTASASNVVNYSARISTAFTCNAFEHYALQVSSVQDASLGGSPSSEGEMKVWGWWNPFSP